MLHIGSGSVMPAVPPVSDVQLVATICSRNRNAIVMITNDGPRVRSAITPSSAANSAADDARRPAPRPTTETSTSGRQDRQRVGPEAEERALAERHVAAVAGDHVQPDRPDREDQGQDDHVLVVEVVRDDRVQQQRRSAQASDDEPGPRDSAAARAHAARHVLAQPRAEQALRAHQQHDEDHDVGHRGRPRRRDVGHRHRLGDAEQQRADAAPGRLPSPPSTTMLEQARDPLVVRARQERIEHADDRAAGAGRRRRRRRTSAPPRRRR